MHFFDYSLWNQYVKDLLPFYRVGHNYYYDSVFQFSLIRISFALRTSL